MMQLFTYLLKFILFNTSINELSDEVLDVDEKDLNYSTSVYCLFVKIIFTFFDFRCITPRLSTATMNSAIAIHTEKTLWQ